MSKLTPEKVRRKVQKIANQNDSESQHSDEDALHRAVLRAIKDGAPDPIGLATAALETTALDFSRWCA